MTLFYGNVYEIKFEESGPRPPGSQEVFPTRVCGINIPDALKRWEDFNSNGSYNYYPPIVSVIQVLQGVYY